VGEKLSFKTLSKVGYLKGYFDRTGFDFRGPFAEVAQDAANPM
jgi:hypothetical protein